MSESSATLVDHSGAIAAIDAAEALLKAAEKTLASEIKQIVNLADRMTKVHGQFQQALFQVLRKAPERSIGEGYFDFVERKVREHFAYEEPIPGTDETHKVTPEIREIEGLSSWAVLKSRLLSGYTVTYKINGKNTVIGKLHPEIDRYAGDDGAKLWLRDIADMQEAKRVQLEAEAKAKQLSATTPPTGGDGTSSTAQSPNTLVDGNGKRILLDEMPDVVKTAYYSLTQTIQEACKHGGDNDYDEAVAEALHDCEQRVAKIMFDAQDVSRARAVREPPTKEQARALLDGIKALKEEAGTPDVETMSMEDLEKLAAG